MPSWKKQKLTLKDKHYWQAKPGHKIFVADKGAVRFDIPVTWLVVPDSPAVKIYDRQPPDDDCALTMTCFHLPPMDWSGLPLTPMLDDSTKKSELDMTFIGEIIEVRRGDLEFVWREMRYIDPKEHREAISRVCTGRRKLVQCLITMDFWLTDLDRCNKVWTTVLETLRLAEFVDDPTTGLPRL
jgi:hypothetical protein